MFAHTPPQQNFSSSSSRTENENNCSELSSVSSSLRRLSIGLGFCGFSKNILKQQQQHHKSTPDLLKNLKNPDSANNFPKHPSEIAHVKKRRHSVQYAQNLGRHGSLYEPDYEPVAAIASDNQYSVPKLWVTVDYMKFMQTITIYLLRAENLNFFSQNSSLVILTQVISNDSSENNSIIGINQQNFKPNPKTAVFNAILRIDDIPENLSSKSLRFTVFQLESKRNAITTMAYLEECTPISQSQFSMQDILDLEENEQKTYCCMLERRKSLQTFKNSENILCSNHLNCSNMPKVMVEFKWSIKKDETKNNNSSLEVKISKLKHIKMKKVVIVVDIYLGLDLLKQISVESKDHISNTDLYVIIDGKVDISCTRENLRRLRLCGSICSRATKKKLFMFDLSADIWENICRNLLEATTKYKNWYPLFSMQ